MATLADAGSKQTNESNPFPYSGTAPISENNPYQQALQGGASADKFAGVQAPGPAAKVPSPVPSDSLSGPRSSSSAAQGVEQQALTQEASQNTAAASVANTPEAMSPSQVASQNAAALKTLEAHPKKANANITSNGKTASPARASEEQDVQAALAPDQAILDALPAQYQSTMAALAPYINSGQSTGDAALNAADKAVSDTVGSTNNAVLAGLTSLGKDSREYAKSVPYSGIIQAELGFQKNEETYQGALPNETDWSSKMDEIYKYLTATNPNSTTGLPPPSTAAAAASSGAVAEANDAAGGGNG